MKSVWARRIGVDTDQASRLVEKKYEAGDDRRIRGECGKRALCLGCTKHSHGGKVFWGGSICRVTSSKGAKGFQAKIDKGPKSSGGGTVTIPNACAKKYRCLL